MKQITALIILFCLFLSGCDENRQTEVVSKTTMPKEMPDDFNFKLKFGVSMKNSMDTYQDLVTKDLVAD